MRADPERPGYFFPEFGALSHMPHSMVQSEIMEMWNAQIEGEEAKVRANQPKPTKEKADPNKALLDFFEQMQKNIEKMANMDKPEDAIAPDNDVKADVVAKSETEDMGLPTPEELAPTQQEVTPAVEETEAPVEDTSVEAPMEESTDASTEATDTSSEDTSEGDSNSGGE